MCVLYDEAYGDDCRCRHDFGTALYLSDQIRQEDFHKFITSVFRGKEVKRVD